MKDICIGMCIGMCVGMHLGMRAGHVYVYARPAIGCGRCPNPTPWAPRALRIRRVQALGLWESSFLIELATVQHDRVHDTHVLTCARARMLPYESRRLLWCIFLQAFSLPAFIKLVQKKKPLGIATVNDTMGVLSTHSLIQHRTSKNKVCYEGPEQGFVLECKATARMKLGIESHKNRSAQDHLLDLTAQHLY